MLNQIQKVMKMKEINISLSKDQMAILNKALLLLPYGEVSELITSIQMQIQSYFDAAKDYD